MARSKSVCETSPVVKRTQLADYDKLPVATTGVHCLQAGLKACLLDRLQADLQRLFFRLLGFRVSNDLHCYLVTHRMLVEHAVQVVGGSDGCTINLDDQVEQRRTRIGTT